MIAYSLWHMAQTGERKRAYLEWLIVSERSKLKMAYGRSHFAGKTGLFCLCYRP